MLTAKDVSLLFRVSPKTVRLWARDGILPFTRIGKKYLFCKREIEGVKSRVRSLKIESEIQESFNRNSLLPLNCEERKRLWL